MSGLGATDHRGLSLQFKTVETVFPIKVFTHSHHENHGVAVNKAVVMTPQLIGVLTKTRMHPKPLEWFFRLKITILVIGYGLAAKPLSERIRRSSISDSFFKEFDYFPSEKHL